MCVHVCTCTHVTQNHTHTHIHTHPQTSMYINRVARYVRIQLAGTNYLSLAEVEVWGYAPIEEWQHIEGMKRWTKLQQVGDFPFGRMGHTGTMITAQTVLVVGGYVMHTHTYIHMYMRVYGPYGDDDHCADSACSWRVCYAYIHILAYIHVCMHVYGPYGNHHRCTNSACSWRVCYTYIHTHTHT